VRPIFANSIKCLSINYRNPGGIRFGTSEIYDVLDACFSPLPIRDSASTIEDALAVGQTIKGGTDERVILFVKLSAGRTLSIELENEIKAEVRSRRSPRHVPARVSGAVCCDHVLIKYPRRRIADRTGARYPVHFERKTC
jgi:hypothetical protein